MIAIIRTDSGNFNIFGTNDLGFCLEGNLTLTELKDLKKQVDAAIKAVAKGS